MRKALKPLIIGVTLLLPVFIYLFLRFFGANQFDVPVFYQAGINPDTVDCAFEGAPHQVVLPLSEPLKDPSANPPYLLIIDLNLSLNEAALKINKLQRVMDHHNLNGQIRVLQFINNEQNQGLGVEQLSPVWFQLGLDLELMTQFALCELILLEFKDSIRNSNRWVVIDQYSRIRGYYDSSDFKDIDRMIVEMEIIMGNS